MRTVPAFRSGLVGDIRFRYYGEHTDKADAFQLRLIGEGNGNFEFEFIYQALPWVSGDASGGRDGLGGTPARAGYSAGNGTNYFELPQSGNQSALQALPQTLGNTGQAGIWLFDVENGVVSTPSTLSLDPSTDSGTLGDDITNVAQPKIDGHGIAGDRVTLFDGTTVVGTGTVATDGTWQITTTTLADGSHSLTATETDAAGTTSAASAALVLTIDTVPPPQPSGLALDPSTDSGTLGDDITNVAQPKIDGHGIAGDTVTLSDGSTVVGTGTVAAAGTWRITTTTLADGSHSLTATETDAAGNTGVASAVLALTIDTVPPPQPSGLALDPSTDNGTLGDDITNVAQPKIDGTGEAGDTLMLFDGMATVGSLIVSPSGSWSFTLGTLSPGTHSISATETDPAGNTSDPSSLLNLIIDPNNALVLGTSGNDTIIDNASNQTINGLGGDDYLAAYGDNNIVAGSDGNDTIIASGNNDIVTGGSGNNRLETAGNGDLIIGGDGGDVIWSFGRNSMVTAGVGDDFIGVLGNDDTIDGGGGNNVIFLTVSNVTLLDGSAVHHDTVIGFDPLNGDRIDLTTDPPANALAHSTLINGGQDTQIALSDGSTIVLRGISSIDASFFNSDVNSSLAAPLQPADLTGDGVSDGATDPAAAVPGVSDLPSPTPLPPAGTTADLVLRQASGQYEIYNIGHNAILAAAPLGQVGSDFRFLGFGSFATPTINEMMLRSGTSGVFEAYAISDNSVIGVANLGAVGSNWQLAGFGQFNGSSTTTDMMLRDSDSGSFVLYNNINNNAVTGANAIGAVGLDWQVQGFGDFNGDGTDDMLLRNAGTGMFEDYDIKNGQLVAAHAMGAVGNDWQFVGVNDLNGDGTDDMMLRNTTTGMFELYTIRNDGVAAASSIGAVGLDWQVTGFGACNGADSTDMVLRNQSSGAFEVYDIAGGQLTGAAPLGAVGLDWQDGGIQVHLLN